MGQLRNNLKGPAAKNYKAWKHNLKATPLVSETSKQKRIGPVAKNAKPWKRRLIMAYAKVLGSRRAGLKGPAAKNYKPRQKS